MTEIKHVVNYLFLVLPPFALGNGISRMITMTAQTNLFLPYGVDLYENPLSFDVMGLNVLILMLEGIALLALNWCLESDSAMTYFRK